MAVSMEAVERVVEGEAPPRLMAEHQARYAFAAPHVAGLRVLDVACGSGYGSRLLRDAGARHVVGVDCSRDAVAYAHRRYGTAGLDFVEADACELADLGRFDVIVSFETIEHLFDPERFLEVCRRALRPGANLFVSSPCRRRVGPDGRPENPFHVREWLPDEFQDLLKSFFDQVTIYGQVLRLAKGALPRSWAAPLAALKGVRLKDPTCIYPLPAPSFFGLWKPFPGYLLAVCQKAASEVLAWRGRVVGGSRIERETLSTEY